MISEGNCGHGDHGRIHEPRAIDDDKCPSLWDAPHWWRFDGDDPYIRCEKCGELRDALSGRVLIAGRRRRP